MNKETMFNEIRRIYKDAERLKIETDTDWLRNSLAAIETLAWATADAYSMHEPPAVPEKHEPPAVPEQTPLL